MKKFLILSAALVAAGLATILSQGLSRPSSPGVPGALEPSTDLVRESATSFTMDVVVDRQALEIDTPASEVEPGTPSPLIGKRSSLENCRDVAVDVDTGSGLSTTTVTQCDTVIRFDEPYDSMSHPELEALARTDAVAALVLADRLAQRHGAGVDVVAQMYLHALALSAHPDAFEALYTYLNGGHGVVYTNGELNVDKTAGAYVWSRVGSHFGYTSAEMVEAYRAALVEYGLQPEVLEPQVEHWTTVIADRQEAIGHGGVR